MKVVGGNGLVRDTEKIAGVVEQNYLSGIGGSLREFLHAIGSGAVPQGECHDNIKSLAMVFAAVESAEVGKRVGVGVD
jgi:hypothetical protein